MSANEKANSSSAARRTWRGDRNEVAIIRIAVGTSISACRSTKWKVERLSRSATAGLAASAMTRPITISATNEPSSQRSTVRIQSATGPRSDSRHHGSRPPSCACARARAPRQPFGDGCAKGLAARLEIGELVERGAGRRQQHHGLLRRRARGVRAAASIAASSVPAALERNRAGERAREFVRRLADQVGLGDAREQGPERLDAARLRPAAENPVDVVKRQQRLLGRVGVGRLRVVDEQHPAQPADLFHAMRKPGKGGEGAGDRARARRRAPRGGVGERGVLPVMGAAKRARAGRRSAAGAGLAARHHAMLADPDVGERRILARDRDDARRAGARLQPRVDFAARLVVDADQRNVGLGDEPLLDRRVAREGRHAGRDGRA